MKASFWPLSSRTTKAVLNSSTRQGGGSGAALLWAAFDLFQHQHEAECDSKASSRNAVPARADEVIE
jgi:hypothetical protein